MTAKVNRSNIGIARNDSLGISGGNDAEPFLPAAIYYRKRPANHKRLMLLTAIGFLPPALARIPIPGIQSLGPLFFFGVPILLMIFAVTYDRVQNGKFNKVFIYACLFLTVSYPLRIMISGTDAWLAFAHWIITFSPV
jgi:hypothetical protein